MDSLSTPRNYCEFLPLNRIALLVWVAGDVAAIAAAFWMLASGRWVGFIGLTFGAFALTATLLVFAGACRFGFASMPAAASRPRVASIASESKLNPEHV